MFLAGNIFKNFFFFCFLVFGCALETLFFILNYVLNNNFNSTIKKKKKTIENYTSKPNQNKSAKKKTELTYLDHN